SSAWTRRYTLVCTEKLLSPDGVPKRMLTWNGTLPGPTLTAVEGDTLEVTVVNRCPVPITAHWHGMVQAVTPYADGVPSVSQCPIAPGKQFVYRFKASPPGTAWYHSHQGVQYMDGLWGPLLISPHPSRKVDLGKIDGVRVIAFSDQYHTPTPELMAWYKSPESQGNEPVPDSGLINGQGRFNCSNAGSKPCTPRPYPRIEVQSGKNYLYHAISAAAFSAFRLSVDDYRMRVVSADLTYIKPVSVDVISINVGQRYSFFLEPLPGTRTDRNAFIRAAMETKCYAYQNPVLDPIVKAVLAFGRGDADTTSSPDRTTGECRLLDYSDLVPLFPIDVPRFRPGLDTQLTLNFVFRNNAQGVNYAYVNGNSYVASPVPTLDLVTRYPSLKYPNGTSVLTPAMNAFVVPDRPPGAWVFVGINNFDNGEHPWHKHSTVSYLLGEGRDGPFRWDSMQRRLNHRNPFRRDTFTVPYGAAGKPAGWAVIAFPADFFGAWVMHCHIEWHVAVGLLAQFVVSP
ncbi:Cupredoxin, partial [Hyaloraphidium curvatum]